MNFFMLLSGEETVKIMASKIYLPVTRRAMPELEVLIDGVGLACTQVRRVAQDLTPVRVDPAGLHRAATAHELVKELATRQPVYGRTTGVGANRLVPVIAEAALSTGPTDAH